MLKFPIYSVLVSQEATSNLEGSNTLLGSQPPSQDGKWKEAGLFFFFFPFFFFCFELLEYCSTGLVFSLSLSPPPLSPLRPLAVCGSEKGQLEPLNEVSECSGLFVLASDQDMLAFHFGALCGAAGLWNIKQPMLITARVFDAFLWKGDPVKRHSLMTWISLPTPFLFCLIISVYFHVMRLF